MSIAQSAAEWDIIERAIQGWVVRASNLPDSNVIWSGYGRRRPNTPGLPDGQWISLNIDNIKQDGLAWLDTEDNPFTFDPVPCTFDLGLRLHAPAHSLATGDGPIRLTTSGGLPAALNTTTDYWVIVVDTNTLELADSFDSAMNEPPIAIAITDAGSGQLSINATDGTLRAGEEVLQVVRMNLSATLSAQCYRDSPTGNRSPKAVLQTVSAAALLPSIRVSLEDAGVGVSDARAINDVGALLNSTKWEPRAHVDFHLWVTSRIAETGTVIETVGVTVATENDVNSFEVRRP